MNKDILELVAIFLAMLVAVFLMAFAPTYLWGKYSCHTYESITGKPTKYQAGDCYIKDGDNWYVWSEYKYRLATKGEMK